MCISSPYTGALHAERYAHFIVEAVYISMNGTQHERSHYVHSCSHTRSELIGEGLSANAINTARKVIVRNSGVASL